jgi:hypothetical protein
MNMTQWITVILAGSVMIVELVQLIRKVPPVMAERWAVFIWCFIVILWVINPIR